MQQLLKKIEILKNLDLTQTAKESLKNKHLTGILKVRFKKKILGYFSFLVAVVFLVFIQVIFTLRKL